MTDPLFSTTDPQGRTVELSRGCFIEHIRYEHPDMSDAEEIEQTIHRAEYICTDATDLARLVYYRTFRRRPERWMIKVVVYAGEVVTAYRVKRIKRGETTIWQR